MSERRKILDLFEEQKSFMQTTVEQGIEKNRKGNALLTVTDAKGNTVKGAMLRVKQLSHEFKFGANLFMLDELETKEKNDAYKQRFAEVFNMATLPFYWDTLELEKGKPRYSKDSEKVYRRPPIDLCMEYCEKHGIEPREHALAYDSFFPKWLKGESVETVKQELERRYQEVSSRYADKIPTIEVTNEMFWERSVTDFYFQPDYVEWCFKKAAEYFPNNQLGINESNWIWVGERCGEYYSCIQENLKKGARIDAIGLQCHHFFPREKEYEETRIYLNPKHLYERMNTFASFGKPLQITEITFPSYSWESEDEEIQADILENMYKVFFSHESVEQIIYWNVVDGYAYVASDDLEAIKKSQGNMQLGENYYHGGLLRFDLTLKPAFERLKQLTQKVWHTEETLYTDEQGKAAFRGFYGEYQIEITVNGKTFTKNVFLSKKQEKEFVISL